MVSYDHAYRLESVLNIVVPSIIIDLNDKDFQLEMLEKNRCKALKLNVKAGNKMPKEDIENIFALAEKEIWKQHKRKETEEAENGLVC